MPSCWRAAAPGLWLVVLSIHFMLLCSLICSPPAPGGVAPQIQLGRNRGAGQKTRSRVTERPQYTNRLLSASQKRKKKKIQIIPLHSTFKTAAQFHTVILA